MNERKIFSLCYISTGCDCLKYENIKSILESAYQNNLALNITGILLYCNKHFLQILEGEKETVLDLFTKISIDRRHDSIVKIQERERENRYFEKWAMAFKSYNKELSCLDNFNTEQFYSYINELLKNNADVSLKIANDFFDLNG